MRNTWIDRHMCRMCAALYTIMFVCLTIILLDGPDVPREDMTHGHWTALAFWVAMGGMTIWSYVHAMREFSASQPKITRRY